MQLIHGRDQAVALFRWVRWRRAGEVQVTTLDALIRRFREPNLSKIDVEGFDAEALAA